MKKEKKITDVEVSVDTPEVEKAPKISNAFKYKRGAYSIIITAVFLAAVIAANWVFITLSDREQWYIDMTPEKIHSMDEANIKYIKSIKEEVQVTIVAKDASEYTQVISSWAPEQYQVYYGEQYYAQTAELVEKYGKYNDNIKVRFLDSQSTEFTEINRKYSDLEIAYGDILVTYKLTDTDERIKKLSFDDIYRSDYYSTYGGTKMVTGNNIESALTNAITYVIGGEAKKAVLLTGHSKNDNTSNYVSLLKLNGYEVVTISDKVVTEIPKDANIVVVMSASIDFYESELTVISEFLDNGGKLGKGFICFADASCPALPSLNAFMSEWGIKLKEGILFESENPDPADSSKIKMQVGDGIEMTGLKSGTMETAYNVPIVTEDPDGSDGTMYTVKNVIVSPETTVIAPIGAGNDWKPENKDDVGEYVGIATSEMLQYDEENNKLTSYVVAFSSVQFIQSEYAEMANSISKNVVLYCTDLAANITEGGVQFAPKQITDEMYTDKTEGGAKTLRAIFVIGLPIGVLALGAYKIIRRKRA